MFSFFYIGQKELMLLSKKKEKKRVDAKLSKGFIWRISYLFLKTISKAQILLCEMKIIRRGCSWIISYLFPEISSKTQFL